MATLSRAAILAADDLAKETVSVPEWGGEIIIGTMTGAARDAWEQSIAGQGGKVNIANIRARMLAYCALDENGNRLFSDADAEALGQKSGAALDRCVRVAQKLNKLTDEDLKEVKGN